MMNPLFSFSFLLMVNFHETETVKDGRKIWKKNVKLKLKTFLHKSPENHYDYE